MADFTISLLSTDEMVCPKCTAEDEMFTCCPLISIPLLIAQQCLPLHIVCYIHDQHIVVIVLLIKVNNYVHVEY